MTENITLPSMSNTNMPGYINTLSKGIPNYFDSYKNLTELPGKIDSWTNESLKRQRVTGDQITSLLGQIGEQRAGSGIMGGTEAQNRQANVLGDLNKLILSNQNNIMNQANTMKAGTIQNTPSMAMLPVNTMANLYSLNAGDQQFWADLAARMINTGY